MLSLVLLVVFFAMVGAMAVYVVRTDKFGEMPRLSRPEAD